MSEKPVKEKRTPLSQRPVVKKSDTVFRVRDDLDERQRPLTKAAAVGAAEPAPAPIPVRSKPLTPVAALWPTATPPGPPKPLEKAAVVGKAPTRTAAPKVKVTFVLLDLGAKQVSLSGEFNGWSPNATPIRRDSSGHWEATVDLAPGRYQYKFVVDGEWIPDPLAHEKVWNQQGTLNSVIEARA